MCGVEVVGSAGEKLQRIGSYEQNTWEHECAFVERQVACCCKWRQTFVLFWCMRASRTSCEFTLPRDAVYDAVF
jgi:hypothetical protein